MRRGDVVVAAARGHHSGKPRPAVVVQTDMMNPTHASVILAFVSGDLLNAPAFRTPVSPTPENGLIAESEIMVDKLAAVPRASIGRVIGRLDEATQVRLDRTLLLVLGLA